MNEPDIKIPTKDFFTLYAYTTKLDKAVGQIKVGETKHENAKLRIEQQDNESNSSPLDILFQTQLPRYNKNNKKITDHFIRKVMINELGCKKTRTDKSREWLIAKIDDLKKAINISYEGVSRCDSFQLREEQKECHEKAVNYFNSGGDEFLINAKMRFGKTFTAMKIAKSLNAKNILIATYIPSVDDGFREIVDDHVDFDGWNFLGNGQELKSDPDAICNVKFTSFQNMFDLSKDKWKELNDSHFDLIIIDEMHYGSDTVNAKDILSKLSYEKTLYISGTAINAIQSGRFTNDQIYRFTYQDEQKLKLQEIRSGKNTELYKWQPTMNMFQFSIGEDVKQNILRYYDDAVFSMERLFQCNDCGFRDRASVKLFMERVFGKVGKKKDSPVLSNAPDHILISMPNSTKSVDSLCKLLEEMIGDEYKILNVSGKHIKKLNHLKEQISINHKTITVTCGRFTTGVTVPEWDMVLMMDDGKSVDQYFQTIFRVQSANPSKNKTDCYVIDYNPERMMSMIYNYSMHNTEHGKSLTETLDTFLEYASIMDYSGNYLREISPSDIFESIKNSNEYLKQFQNETLFNVHFIDDSILDILKNIKSEKTNNKIIFNTNGLNTKANNNPKVSASNTKKKETNKQKLIEKAKRITAEMPRMLVHIGGKDTFDLIKNSKKNEELFYKICQVTPDNFEKLCKCNFIKTNILDQMIVTFNVDMEII